MAHLQPLFSLVTSPAAEGYPVVSLPSTAAVHQWEGRVYSNEAPTTSGRRILLLAFGRPIYASKSLYPPSNQSLKHRKYSSSALIDQIVNCYY